MSSKRMYSVLEKLARGTDNHEVAWKESSSDLTFVAVVGGISTSVSQDTPSYDGDAYHYRLKIYNEKGSLIEEATEDDFDGMKNGPKVLENLYESARRQALKVDETLDKLIKTLDNEHIPF